jgi:methionyl-tRNA formyltransferase
VRALNPHIRTYLELPDGERLGVRSAAPAERNLEAGAFEADGESLLLGCGSGALRLDVVQPPGGRALAAAEYLRGHTPPSRAA